MKQISNFMKSLVYDRELVKLTRANKVNKELLYNHLISGKITMPEYFSLV